MLSSFLNLVSNITIGGQALIEGVMMRSPTAMAIAVRRANGDITLKKRFILPLRKKYPFLGWPVLRGIVALIHSLVLGLGALNYSANVALEDVAEEEKKKGKAKENSSEMGKIALTLTMFAAMGLGVLLFIVLPLFLTGILKNMYPILNNSLAYNSVDGLFRVSIFLIYIVSISFIHDIRRVFEYHGAEHKAVFCFEANEELTVENCRKFSTLHPRCGTNFLLIVMFISVFCFTFFPVGLPFYTKILYRFILVPLIGGVGFEVIRYGGRNADSGIGKLVRLGLMLQKITTKEPTDEQQEVALKALEEALYMEGEGDAGHAGVS